MAMMLLTEIRCGEVKGRMVFDGRRTREWITKEDSASPTATLEGIMLTSTINDPCIAYRMVNGKQHTVRFHVDVFPVLTYKPKFT